MTQWRRWWLLRKWPHQHESPFTVLPMSWVQSIATHKKQQLKIVMRRVQTIFGKGSRPVAALLLIIADKWPVAAVDCCQSFDISAAAAAARHHRRRCLFFVFYSLLFSVLVAIRFNSTKRGKQSDRRRSSTIDNQCQKQRQQRCTKKRDTHAHPITNDQWLLTRDKQNMDTTPLREQKCKKLQSWLWGDCDQVPISAVDNEMFGAHFSAITRWPPYSLVTFSFIALDIQTFGNEWKLTFVCFFTLSSFSVGVLYFSYLSKVESFWKIVFRLLETQVFLLT